MIDLPMAQQLKEAGLEWSPEINDFFGLPERHMDERLFVISDMLVTVDMLQGMQVVSFQGASEWALDYLVTTEAVWIPTEEQLRRTLQAVLLEGGRPELRLTTGLEGCRLDFVYQGDQLSFVHEQASDAYASGLLHILRSRDMQDDGSGRGD